MTNYAPFPPGVLSSAQLQKLCDSGAITSSNAKIGASAIDLPIGNQAWLLSASGRPATRQLQLIMRDAQQVEVTREAGGSAYFEFQVRNIYLVALSTYLKLPANINGRATGKSSIGRLDVITRLLTENGSEYDVVRSGYEGKLYLLVMPQTFSIRVSVGSSLNQLRLFCGAPANSLVRQGTIGDYGVPCWYVLEHSSGTYSQWSDLIKPGDATDDPALFDMTVDLEDPRQPYILKARQDRPIIDPRSADKSLDWQEYSESVEIADIHNKKTVALERDGFYIMKSRERLSIPNDLAVEVVAISERIGDIRIHYAGFAHPGFGTHNDPLRKGTPLILEVRATDMKTLLYDGSLLAKMQLFRMSQTACPDPSKYEMQELNLSNVFTDTPRRNV